jgi:putative transposase
MERINKEFKRESRMIGVFPNQESVLILTVSILIDINEDGITENKYIIMK